MASCAFKTGQHCALNREGSSVSMVYFSQMAACLLVRQKELLCEINQERACSLTILRLV